MNLPVTTNQKCIIKHTKKRNKSKHNIKDTHQVTMEERKRLKECKRTTKQPQINEQNGIKYIHINNCFKCKWTKCSNQMTEWLNEYKNKTHIYAAYK